MMDANDPKRRPTLQLHLDLGESPAPPTALWEVLPEAERRAAATLLAAMIAQTVAPPEESDPLEGDGDE
jgi:hypothetical protein